MAAISHYVQIHPNEIQKCPKCETLITNSRSLPNHWRTEHPQEIMPYYMSLDKYYRIELFQQFYNKYCKICMRTMETIAESRAHFHEKHNVVFEVCTICSEGFQTYTMLQAHNSRQHSHVSTEIDSDCAYSEIPDKTTVREVDNPLIGNEESYRVKYPFITSLECPICSNAYTSRPAVRNHYKVVHAKNGIPCELCGTKCANEIHQKQHWLAVHKNIPWKVDAIIMSFFVL